MALGPARRLGGGLLLALAAAAARGDPAMEFEPNAPGTYTLQRIMATADGAVVDSTGVDRRLKPYLHGRITLLSFIYSSCADPEGCPYATVVFHRVKEALEGIPEARGKVRLISLSFDPQRDTPERLALYGGTEANREAPIRWDYLTTRGLSRLLPILKDFGQDVSVDLDEQGKPRGTFSHVLKVFLIDAQGQVREIYTTSYLLPKVVVNDIRNLLMERPRK
jgi:protein SCO1/2